MSPARTPGSSTPLQVSSERLELSASTFAGLCGIQFHHEDMFRPGFALVEESGLQALLPRTLGLQAYRVLPTVGDGGVALPERLELSLVRVRSPVVFPIDRRKQCGLLTTCPGQCFYFRQKSAIRAGVAESNPTTSSIPASLGSAIVNPLETIPTTTSLAGISIFFRYSLSACTGCCDPA